MNNEFGLINTRDLSMLLQEGSLIIPSNIPESYLIKLRENPIIVDRSIDEFYSAYSGIIKITECTTLLAGSKVIPNKCINITNDSKNKMYLNEKITECNLDKFVEVTNVELNSINLNKNFLHYIDPRLLVLENTNLDNFDGSNLTKLRYLGIPNNNIFGSISLPETLLDADISKNNITEVLNIPKTLLCLNASNNNLTKFPHIQYKEMGSRKIISEVIKEMNLEWLSRQVNNKPREFDLSFNNISNLSNIPINFTYKINLSNNKLTNLNSDLYNIFIDVTNNPDLLWIDTSKFLHLKHNIDPIKSAEIRDGIKLSKWHPSTETKFSSLLKLLNLEYVREYPLWVTETKEGYPTYIVDYYIPKYKLFLECDGDWKYATINNVSIINKSYIDRKNKIESFTGIKLLNIKQSDCEYYINNPFEFSIFLSKHINSH